METSVSVEQPQRVVKVWSHNIVGNVTLLAMLTLIVLGWLPLRVSVSTSSAVALGAFAGFVVAAINWIRMGRRWKGLFHLLISPLIYLIIPLGLTLLLALIINLLSAGSAERAVEISQGISSTLVLALYFGAAFLIIAYLYTMTKRDIAHLRVKGITVQYANFLPPLGITALCVIILWIVNIVAGQAYRASAQNHVYCELLHPGMTQEEVTTVLKEIGLFYQVPVSEWESRYRRKDGGEYRIIYWDKSDIELKYDLWLWIGYDKDGRLDWRGRYTGSNGLIPIQCPWTFYQSVTAR